MGTERHHTLSINLALIVPRVKNGKETLAQGVFVKGNVLVGFAKVIALRSSSGDAEKNPQLHFGTWLRLSLLQSCPVTLSLAEVVRLTRDSL